MVWDIVLANFDHTAVYHVSFNLIVVPDSLSRKFVKVNGEPVLAEPG